MRRGLLSALAAAMVVGMLLVWPVQAQSGQPKPTPQSWLDGPRRDWNTAGMAIPSPSTPMSAEGCESSIRPAETPEDEAVVAAGWQLRAPYRAAWGIKVIEGNAGFGGMCRPIQYVEFVFVDGVFAGTIAPGVMSSTSGDPGRVDWFDVDSVWVRFSRYKTGDSACCPSGEPVNVFFQINRTPSGPVLLIDRKQ